MSNKPKIAIEDPLVIMYKDGQGGVTCRLYPGSTTYNGYGKLICDLARHVAHAFNIDEESVWEAIDKERKSPTAKISQLS